MSEKRNKKSNRKGSLLLIGALLMTCAAAGTVAKYQTTLGGSSTVQVAKFDVTATNLGTGTSTDIQLFDTILDTDVENAETDVATGADSSKRIAPGTSGKTTITITNNSEVNVEAALALAVTNNGLNVPFEFSLDKTNWKTVDQLNALSDFKPELTTTTPNKEKVINLYWRWAIGNGTTDTTDTTIGTSANLNQDANKPTVTVTMTASQKD